jgi:hypothetical protein
MFLILAQKLILIICLLFSPQVFPAFFGTTDLSRRLTAGDSSYYLHIAANGYDDSIGICAFYPLWPACIRIGSWLTRGDLVLSAWLLANVFSFIGLLTFRFAVCRECNKPLANQATLLLLLYPGSVFFFVPYSESLFLLLLMACFVSLQRNTLWGVAVAAFFLPMTRAIGIFILPVLAWHLFSNGANLRRYFVCLAPAAGYLCLFGIMYWFTNNPFEGFVAQGLYPAQPSILRIFDVPGFFHSFMNFRWTHDCLHSVIDRAIFVAFLLSLYWIHRLNRTYYVYALLTGLIPAMSNIFMSYTRFLSLVFPVFIIWSQLAHNSRTFPVLLVLSFVFQVVFLILFVSGRWVG